MRLLQLDRLELYGGNRTLEFHPGVNVVYGPIATGKSTIVKLIRALLGTIPDDLPPGGDKQCLRLEGCGDNGHHDMEHLASPGDHGHSSCRDCRTQRVTSRTGFEANTESSRGDGFCTAGR
jgi:AAA domain